MSLHLTRSDVMVKLRTSEQAFPIPDGEEEICVSKENTALPVAKRHVRDVNVFIALSHGHYCSMRHTLER